MLWRERSSSSTVLSIKVRGKHATGSGVQQNLLVPRLSLTHPFLMEAFFEPGPAAGGMLGTQEETCTVPPLLFLKFSDREMHQRWAATLVPLTLQQNNNNIIKKRKIDLQHSADSVMPQTTTLALELFPPSNYPTWTQEQHVLMAPVKVTKQIHKIKNMGSFIFHGTRRQVPSRGDVYSGHACHSKWIFTRKF